MMGLSVRLVGVALALCVGTVGCRRAPDSAQPPAAQPPAGSYSAFTARLSSPGDSSVALAGAEVSRDFFPDPPMLGRTLLDADYASGGSPVAVISHSLWSTRFRSAPDLIGRTIEVDGQARVVVGVTAPGFRPVGAGELWVPRPPGGARP